ncbi:hypothetical protein GCM10011611_30860 [Aliidongia dinghuensis]|uniref:Uncharacterized protein n=1 Tax=Aliidongia dinghuensis TaxID=1867774 RepID=A0A8J3E3Y3_9PROT|nr:hypothetical protein [Aliidongia dinghuensis]GGF22610.1 hypothetical protein GCM10011611_30860 [Aliidongia dinghuensis]
MSKRVLSGVLAASLVLASTLAHAECYTEAEWQAAHVRILQTELNVAQLTCQNVPDHSYDAQYSAFVARFGDRLKSAASVLRAHFKRVYGNAASEKQLDIFVTRVANEASDRSMSSTTPCADAAPLFQQVLATDTGGLSQLALDHVTDKTEIGGELCVAKKAPASRKSGRTKKTVAVK